MHCLSLAMLEIYVMVCRFNCDYRYAYVLIIIKMFSYLLHMTNTVTYFKHFSLKKNIQSLKENMFKLGFLKYKNYFLAFWILQHVCKFQRVLANIPKI